MSRVWCLECGVEGVVGFECRLVGAGFSHV